MSAVAGDDGQQDGEDSIRSRLKRAPVSTVDFSESDTLGLLARLRGAGAGTGAGATAGAGSERTFLDGRPRPRFVGEGVAIFLEVVRESIGLVGVSSAEESPSSLGAAALRFRESGVIASNRIFFWLVGVDAFFRSLLPMDFDTRVNELILDGRCDC